MVAIGHNVDLPMTRDCTNSLEQELYDEMRQSSELFDFIVAGSLDGIWYWNLKDPSKEYMSPRFWQTFGIDPKTKKHEAAEWQSLIHPDDLKTALAAFERHSEDPQCPYDVEVRYRHANGHWVWVRCRGLILRDEDGQPHRMVGAHSDITSLKEREIALNTKVNELKVANEALQEFANVASHDLRSPMTAVSQLAEILVEDVGDKLDERQLRMLTLIRSRSETLGLLLKSMLEYVRVNDDVAREPASFVDLRAAVDEAHQLYGREGDEIVVKGDAVAYAIPSHVHAIFRNLVSNAMKHKDGPNVSISVNLREVAGMATVLFDDDGPGIAAPYRATVFQLFRTLHPKDTKSGVGLGLAMSRRMCANAGGDISIVDKDTPGTRFVVRLPTAPPNY